MNCRTEWQPFTDTLAIWLWTSDGQTTRVLQHVEGDVWKHEEYPVGQQDIPPTIVLNSLWAKVLAKELSKLPTADDATVAALKDAQSVRDRLLRIVEHKMGVKD